MLQPKRTKFRKAFKGRIHGNAKGGTELNFGAYGLKAMASASFSATRRGAFCLPMAYLLPLRSAAWPGKKRVGANSPSFIPTMSSLTDTGTNLRPL